MIWEKTMELLRRNGWDFIFGKFIDLETQSRIYFVSVQRGDQRMIGLFPTLEEAARTLDLFVMSASA